MDLQNIANRSVRTAHALIQNKQSRLNLIAAITDDDDDDDDDHYRTVQEYVSLVGPGLWMRQ